eukprot:4684-Heterococcus_DN1.PRE.2
MSKANTRSLLLLPCVLDTFQDASSELPPDAEDLAVFVQGVLEQMVSAFSTSILPLLNARKA